RYVTAFAVVTAAMEPCQVALLLMPPAISLARQASSAHMQTVRFTGSMEGATFKRCTIFAPDHPVATESLPIRSWSSTHPAICLALPNKEARAPSGQCLN